MCIVYIVITSFIGQVEFCTLFCVDKFSRLLQVQGHSDRGRYGEA